MTVAITCTVFRNSLTLPKIMSMNFSHSRRVSFPLASDVIQQRMKKLQERQNQCTSPLQASPDSAELPIERKETNYQSSCRTNSTSIQYTTENKSKKQDEFVKQANFDHASYTGNISSKVVVGVDKEELINQNERNHRFRRQTFFSLVLRIWKDALDDLKEQRRRGRRRRLEKEEKEKEKGKINFQLSKSEKSQENKRGEKEPIQLDESHETSPINTLNGSNVGQVNIKCEHTKSSQLNSFNDTDEEFYPVSSIHLDVATLNQITNVNELKWKLIFRFPYIMSFFLINRLKVYQTLLVSLAGIGITANGIYEATWSLSDTFAIGGCVVTFATLTLLGSISTKVIALVYIDSTGQLIRISHFNFWARRRDSIFPLSTIRTILPLSARDWYGHLIVVPKEKKSENDEKLKITVDERDFYISLKYGGIVDEDSFMRIFGKSALEEK